MNHRRVELPSRRWGVTVSVEWIELGWEITVGLDPDGTAGEIFIDAPKDAGVELKALFHDIAIATSIFVLQRGVRAAELRPRLSDRPPSLLAIAIAAAEEIEAEFGPGVAALYQAAGAAASGGENGVEEKE